jgi:hypothetical protein
MPPQARKRAEEAMRKASEARSPLSAWQVFWSGVKQDLSVGAVFLALAVLVLVGLLFVYGGVKS